MLRRKVAALLERMAFSPTSHSGRDVIEILEDYPRDELVQVPLDELHHAVDEIRNLQERQQLRLFLRHDHRARYVSALVYLPRDRYTTAGCLRLEQIPAMRSMQIRSNTPPGCRTRFWPDCTSSYAVPMRHRLPRPTTRSWNDGSRTRHVPGLTILLTG